MTREEAIHIVDVAFGIPQAVRRAGENRTYREDEVREAKSMAIEALEQEFIFDKIRAEIEQMPSELTADGRRMIRRESVFRILDKYKAERRE